MKQKLLILLLLALALALTLMPIALARAAQAAPAPEDRSVLTLDTEMLRDGHYQLTSVSGQVSSGGKYYLVGPASPELNGNGCCCTYLPCIMR